MHRSKLYEAEADRAQVAIRWESRDGFEVQPAGRLLAAWRAMGSGQISTELATAILATSASGQSANARRAVPMKPWSQMGWRNTKRRSRENESSEGLLGLLPSGGWKGDKESSARVKPHSRMCSHQIWSPLRDRPLTLCIRNQFSDLHQVSLQRHWQC
jgi:hypothetical protein